MFLHQLQAGFEAQPLAARIPLFCWHEDTATHPVADVSSFMLLLPPVLQDAAEKAATKMIAAAAEAAAAKAKSAKAASQVEAFSALHQVC